MIVFGTMPWAVTGANVVPATRAGDGVAAVGSFTVSSFAYALDATTTSNIDAVTFTISPSSAGTVQVLLNGTTYACTNSGGNVSCATTSPQASVAAATTLKVVAAT